MRGGRATTYAAVRDEDSVDVLFRIPAVFARMTGCDPAALEVETVPWNILPVQGIRAVVAGELAAAGERAVLFVGSCAGGVWASWYLAVPAPHPAPR